MNDDAYDAIQDLLADAREQAKGFSLGPKSRWRRGDRVRVDGRLATVDHVVDDLSIALIFDDEARQAREDGMLPPRVWPLPEELRMVEPAPDDADDDLEADVQAAIASIIGTGGSGNIQSPYGPDGCTS